MALKDQQRQTKELQIQIKEEKDRAKQLKRQRTEENKKRKLENQRKAEIVQPIKNTAKIKKMKKKQLRMIETR
ncbi:coiled-coil domain-containing protein 86-like [Elysia marginata]|uniref:Coiled-coil domain-containing protein 86 n=1 Tax=Elysia marginata TaxID=1093978 RepID=A0AAV4FMN6_9GAST|nr:coiled-coil domain-containing protein 86-like [Elysia marginata]